MEKNPQFTFEVSVSKDYYLKKPSGVDYARMRWMKKTVTLSHFISLVMGGHSYCHIYFNNLRRKDKFMHTNIVSIDVDDTDICIADFVRSIQLKPTFAYETFSNGKDGTFSYRLVYVIAEPMNRRCFNEMYEKICRMTGLEHTKDHCGKQITQLMNGTTLNAYCYRSNIIYSSITDLPVDSTLDAQLECNDEGLIPLVNKNNFPNNINIPPNIPKQYNSKVQNRKNRYEELHSMLDYLSRYGREKFLQVGKRFYELIRWSQLEYNEYGYAVIPEDHLSLFVRYCYFGKECHVNRFKDGEKRRNRLFIDGCIIRKIKPGIKVHELFYNLVHRVHWYYDNSDGVLSDELIADKTCDVMEYDVESMTFASMHAGSITTSASYCRANGVSRFSHSRKALMMENYAGIEDWYNPAMTIS